MSSILYYPYIDIPRTDWTLRTLLYYDNVASIVPQGYFYDPEKYYEKHMLELVRSELVTPINPIEILDQPREVMKPFIEMIEQNLNKLAKEKENFQKEEFVTNRIHIDKFDESVFSKLEELGLAERIDRNWYSVEKKTANNLMKFLATIIGAKTNKIPTTDYLKPFSYKKSFGKEQSKRETILKGLIPFPEELDLTKLKKFKEKHLDLLTAFRTRIDLIALDPNIVEGTALFQTHLAELFQRRDELTAKMSENRFGSIFFGTVCGLIGPSISIASNSKPLEIIGAIPGFANAIYSALQIEKAEKVFDQSGLKYLALADKQLRKR